MAAKRNPIHINAVPSLYQLGAHVNQMSRDAFVKPLTDEQKQELVRLSIAAFIASGISQQEMLTALNVPQVNGTSLKPAPASIGSDVKVTMEGNIVPVTAGTAAQPEKKGIFNR